MKTAFLALVASAWVAFAAKAQDSTQKPRKATEATRDARTTNPAFHRIVMVYDPETQEGIPGAEVVDNITHNKVVTSATGHFALVPGFVKETGALLDIRKVGYAPIAGFLIDPTAGADTILLVPMTKAAVALPTVTTTEKFNLNTDAGLREGFGARCQSKLVTCFQESEMAAHPAATLSYFLNQTSGVIPGCGATFTRGNRSKRPGSGPGGKTPACIKMRGAGVRATQLCVPTYLVDGFVRGSSEATLDDIEDFLGTTQVQGIEVYLSVSVLKR